MSGGKELWDAAGRGDTQAVGQQLTAGVDPNSSCRHGPDATTPLFLATENGHIETVKCLLDHGAFIDSGWVHRQSGYDTPLEVAIDKGHTDIAVLLIQRGAGLRRALHRAAGCGNVDIAARILTAGANINGRIEFEVTPLICAIEGGQGPMIDWLLTQGADPNIRYKDVWGRSDLRPVHAAVLIGEYALRNGARPDEYIRRLIAEGADPNVRCWQEYGADRTRSYVAPPESDRSGDHSPLMMAWRHEEFKQQQRLDVIRALLECGADPDVQNRDKSTVLHLAAIKGALDVVELLVAHRADVLLRANEGGNGWTARKYAEKNAHRGVAQILLRREKLGPNSVPGRPTPKMAVNAKPQEPWPPAPLWQLTHSEWETRARAVERLGKSGDERAVPYLIDALRDEILTVRVSAIDALVRIGTPYFERLLDALHDDDTGVRIAAVRDLGRIGDSRAVDPLERMLETESQAKDEIGEALRRIHDTQILRGFDESNRILAVQRKRAAQNCCLLCGGTLNTFERLTLQFKHRRCKDFRG